MPKRLGVIGAGVIGLEMGSVWRRLGSEVTILEALPPSSAPPTRRSRRRPAKVFAKQGLKIELGVKIAKVAVEEKRVKFEYTASDRSAQNAGVRPADRLDRPGAEYRRPERRQASGLKLDERGFVAVDEDCRTSLPGVWAIGDVVRGPMLAHKAEEEGVAVAERIAGQKPHVELQHHPLGDLHRARDRLGRQDRAAAEGAKASSTAPARFPFSANGRARALGDTDRAW